ncbi:POK18 protein, partial [Alopecoenas beccarii]|nr:POK18 protein [Alopecoenas beccarii]
IQHLQMVMAWLGKPKTIKTDNGPCFSAKAFTSWCEEWDIELKHGIPYNSTGQAIIERAHRT